MNSPPGKLRTRAHVLADLSVNYVERQVLLCGFSVDRVQHDYGYDLIMSTFNATGEFEPGGVYIQVKRGCNMIRPRMNFAQLRQLLLDMGFTETVTPKSHVFFAHQASGAEIALPIYRSNRIVLPHHLATVRIMLDAKGLMDKNDFDELVASASAEQSAS
jgi:predicted RNA binding protein YcfA (HicA-like mRNA interferase family)